MTFTNFIKRPVLSTVVSIFFVLLGIIGIISLPIEQWRRLPFRCRQPIQEPMHRRCLTPSLRLLRKVSTVWRT